MSSIKVSALTAKTTPAGTEELLINDSGVSKKITIANLPDTDTTYSNFAGTTAGLVPTSTTGDDTKFLRADGTWVVPTDTDTNTTYTSSDFTHNDLSGVTANEHIDWTTDQGATNVHSGNYTDTDTVYTHPNHSGDVTSTADGATVISAGAVDIAMLSATGTAGATNFLRGDNTWVVPTDTNTTYTSSDFTHDDLTGFVANEHIDWTTDQGATNIDDGNLTGSPTFTTLNATTVDLGNWTVTETAGVLIFASSGTNKAKLDASGNFTVTGDVISNGTV